MSKYPGKTEQDLISLRKGAEQQKINELIF